MLVSYTELCEFVEDGVIVGSKFSDVNGTSIDVYLGNKIMVECPISAVVSLRDKQRLSMQELDIGGEFYDLTPGEFILAHTRETFNLPANISAEFKLNSSGARIGLENALATWCLVGDTEIATLDGGIVKIKNLVDSDGAWVYAVSSDGNLVPARATASRVTKEVYETVRITLDNGEHFECTTDHKVLMRDNTFVEAGKLTTGVALMPLNRRVNSEGREEVYTFNPGKAGLHSGKWTPTHRLVAEETYVKFKRQNWPTVKTLIAAFGSFNSALSAAGYQNHKVLSVEHITHANPVPVYDLTVPEHHNFGLACGAFVHNCDPRWHGSVLTLELKNFCQHHTIRLHDGVRIGQMIFHKSEPVPEDKSYAVRGRYNNDSSVSGVKL